MKAETANEILLAIDLFSEPISVLAEKLRGIEDEQLRSSLLASLGEVMGLLENQIGRKTRRAASI